ncbi:MAG: rRNA pseudouridine synthase [Dorea sp.]|nr:rRNA pseudouridine synthase [Dorea sp.]
MIRLDKYMADMGVGTRQEVKKQIRQGRVCVNDNVVKSADLKINEELDLVSVDGNVITYTTMEYYILNKPGGVVSATEDAHDQTVVDLITDKKRKDLFPVGRLDKDTEGLLLITNDGALAHRLLSPKKHVDKIYYARVRGKVTEEDVESFRKGVNIGTAECEEWTRSGTLQILNSADVSEIRLTISEGKYHQVKRMFQAVQKEVLYLKREAMGPLYLDPDLQPGEYRSLTKEEIENVTKWNVK